MLDSKVDEVILEELGMTRREYHNLSFSGQVAAGAVNGCMGVFLHPLEKVVGLGGGFGMVGSALMFIATIADKNLSRFATPENMNGLGEVFVVSLGMLGVSKLMEIARKVDKK